MAASTATPTAKKKSKNALKIYRGLNKEQRQLIKTKKIEGRYKIKHWLNMFQDLAIMDRYGDRSRKTMKVLMYVGIFLTIFGGIFTLGLASEVPEILIAPAVLLILTVFFIIRVLQLKRIDLINQFRLFAMPVLAVLREEAKPDAKIFIKLDLTKPFGKDKIIERKKNRLMFQTETFYQWTWMTCQMTLNDDTTLDFDMTDTIRLRTIRGKKTKHKVKITHLFQFTLGFPKSRYKPVEKAQNVKMGQKNDRYVLKVKGNLSAKHKTKGESRPSLPENDKIDLNQFLSRIAAAYRSVEPITK